MYIYPVTLSLQWKEVVIRSLTILSKGIIVKGIIVIL
jgi:hypothetical protein